MFGFLGIVYLKSTGHFVGYWFTACSLLKYAKKLGIVREVVDDGDSYDNLDFSIRVRILQR